MKTAFSVWEHRIAPVFDTARQIHLVESDGSQVSSETAHLLSEESMAARIAWLTEIGVDTLVCGAISRRLQAEVVDAGIAVVPFVAGELQQIIQASFDGTISDVKFRMPGCCGGRGLRRRAGGGRPDGGGRFDGSGRLEGMGRRCGGRNRF